MRSDSTINKITTLKDIAKEVGLSATAVSKALNNKGGISKEKENIIKETANKLNYAPNTIAKSLRLKNTRTIGVVVSDSSQSFFAKVVKGIEDTATNLGYSIILCNTNQDIEKERNAIRVLLSKRIDGIALASSMLTNIRDMVFLKSLGIPFVFFIRRSESDEADYVANDNILGAYMMTNYLLKTNKDKIHFLNLNEESPSGKDRLVGYRKAYEENGMKFDNSRIYYLKPTIEEGYIMMRQLLDRGEDVKTVFCGCDVIGIGVMEAILEKGLRIPEDIRVAAYDDIDFAAYLRIPLTTVRQPKYSIGCKGTELLVSKIKNPHSKVQHVILKPELVIRQST